MTIKANRQSNLLEYSEGWISIIVNTVLFVLKFWAGLTIGSIAITADAWHTLSDSLTSVVVLIGIRVSSKPPDRTHPFGHGRAELMASMIIGVLLAVVAFNFLLESVSNLRDHSPVTYSRFAVVVFAVSILMKEGLTQYAFWVGKKKKAKSIIADGWHHRSDAIASAIILLGMLVGANLWWIDGTLGVMVAVLIFYAAYSILLSAIRPLMGERVERELIEKVNFISKKTYPKDISLHHFHVHRYGKHTELTLHIRLSGDMHIEDSHAIARRIEELIKEQLGIDATIHVETAGDTSR